MYLLNCGVFDAKGVIHPTVVGLELRRAYPRHRVVGAAWQHAQEWVRANMNLIVKMYGEHGNIDLNKALCLTEECFKDDLPSSVGEALWTETFDGLGDACHAFPRTEFEVASFERITEERQHLVVTTDGDHAMWKGVREALAGGKTDRMWNCGKKGERHVDACSFHKWQTLENMIDDDIRQAVRDRQQDPVKWDRRHKGGKALATTAKPCFQNNFGDMIDIPMQHDVHAIGNVAWDLVVKEAVLMGMAKGAARWTKQHHPSDGLKGSFGRCNNTYECPEDKEGSHLHPLARCVDGVWLLINKGSSSSANSTESRFNKPLKTGAGKPLHFGPMNDNISAVCANLTRQCSGGLNYSVVPDFFGRCQSLRQVRKHGRLGRGTTSRGYRQMFEKGINHAGGQIIADQYFKVGTGSKHKAEYIVASDQTIKLIADILEFKKSTDTVADTAYYLRLLRNGWEFFIKDPAGYIAKLRADAKEWNSDQAAAHFQEYKFPYGKWSATEWQIHQIVKNDVLYLSSAFHRVRPHTPLDQVNATRVMTEVWRRLKPTEDPWDTDIRFFECLHCNQYSKCGYCVHVATVTMLEEILPGIPRTFENCGFVRDVVRGNQHTTHVPLALPTRYAVDQLQGSPLKADPRGSNPRDRLHNSIRGYQQKETGGQEVVARQRYSCQPKDRKFRGHPGT